MCAYFKKTLVLKRSGDLPDVHRARAPRDLKLMLLLALLGSGAEEQAGHERHKCLFIRSGRSAECGFTY